ncbi:MAG: hypothetical protein HY711_00980 [Candidatus Melainabacteria bacterium]|nr:hypothetical protein [Candidatus Melainabacteria bacterium]
MTSDKPESKKKSTKSAQIQKFVAYCESPQGQKALSDSGLQPAQIQAMVERAAWLVDPDINRFPNAIEPYRDCRRIRQRLFSLTASWITGLNLLVCVYGAAQALPNQHKQVDAIYDHIPESIDTSGKYLIYLHGKVIEDQGPHATIRQHGSYQYHAILRAIAGHGFIVISEVRQPRTIGSKYAHKVAEQVRSLIQAGVQAENITVAGFSKGGGIAIMTSALLQNPKINFVILAGCGKGPRSGHQNTLAQQYGPYLHGRMLSLYDAADESTGTCQECFDRASGLNHKEIVLQTGLGHGLFFAPHKEWLNIVFDFAGKPSVKMPSE